MNINNYAYFAVQNIYGFYNLLIFKLFILYFLFAISIKSYKLFKNKNSIKMLLIGVGFLFASIFHLFHLYYFISDQFLLVHNSNYQILEYIYPVLSDILMAFSILLSLIQPKSVETIQTISKTKKNFIAFLSLFVLFIILSLETLSRVSPESFNFYISRFLLYNPAFDVIDNAVFFLSAYIYYDLKKQEEKPFFTPVFSVLLLISMLKFYFVTPEYRTLLESLIVTYSKLIFSFILFINLEDLDFTNKFFGIRQKVLIYTSLLLTSFYFILLLTITAFTNVIFNFSIEYVFAAFYIIALFIIYIFTASITTQFDKLMKNLENITPNQRHFTLNIKNSDEVGILADKINSIFNMIESYANKEEGIRNLLISLVRSVDKKDVIRNIVVQTGLLFNADRVFFVEYDAENDNYLPVNDYQIFVNNLQAKKLKGIEFLKSEINPFTLNLFYRREVIAVNNVDEISLPDITLELIKKLEVKSFIIAPLIYMEKPLGFLFINFIKEQKEFSTSDIELMRTISSQSAAAIKQSSLFNEISEKIETENFLRKIINEVLQSKNINNALENIVKEVGTYLNADRTVFRFFDKNLSVFSDVIAEYVKDVSIPSLLGKNSNSKDLDNCIIKAILAKEQSIIINNIEEYEKFCHYKEDLELRGVKSAIILPVLNKEDEPVGILIISTIKNHREWKTEEIELLKPVVQQISIGIDLFKLHSLLESSLDSERTIRDLILHSRNVNNHDDIFDYFLKKALHLYNADRLLHLHYTPNKIVNVMNEALKDNSHNSLLNKHLPLLEYLDDIYSQRNENVIVVKDIENDDLNEELKVFFRQNKICSFILYPHINRDNQFINIDPNNPFTSSNMICSSTPRFWTDEEIDVLKLMIDNVTLIYFENQKRINTEEIRKTFFATLTHDLRSPIIAEQKALEYMMSKGSALNSATYIEYLRDIYKTNEDLLRIVNNILSVYHYDTEKHELNRQKINIGLIVDKSIRTVRHLAADQNDELIINIPDNLPQIAVDENEISRVISNLIYNAITHNRKGIKITVSARQEGTNIITSISDTGEGISVEDQFKIFQRYPTEKRKIGTGLGLYLSKQIIEAHGGTIWFESEVGKGTTFSFSLSA
ncbi:MAG: GAF domain-containing sensor histidine kinase [bacterium]